MSDHYTLLHNLLTIGWNTDVQGFFANNLGMLFNGHAKLRSAAIDLNKIIKTSEKRFIDIYSVYKAHPSVGRLEEELRKLLHNPNNICLVLWQGWLGMLAFYNATRVRRHAVEAADEWKQFVMAQDSDLLIGAV